MKDADQRRPAALLIDADNVTSAAVDHAMRYLEAGGHRLVVKRAYGGHEKLAGMRECLLRHGARAFVNHGKGTTDALLVIDAMDMLHGGLLPQVIAIASSDADFAPLAVRLRESGATVLCFAHVDKAADAELDRCYDQLVYVDVPSAAAPPVNARPAAPAPAPARKTARKTPAKRAAAAPAPAPAPDPLRQLLETFDGLSAGREVALNDVVKKLRGEGLLGRNASGAVFLKKRAPYLELLPPDQPNKVRLRPHRA